MNHTRQAVTLLKREIGRVETFSDGVFAIAITLLVLDLKVPRAESLPSDAGVWQYLLDQWPVFMAYVVSFFTILIMWGSRQQLFTQIRRIDTIFMYSNGFLSLFISVVPPHIASCGAHSA